MVAQDDDDDDEGLAQAELARNMRAPEMVPGDKVVTSPGDRVAYVMFVGQLPNMPAGYWVGVQYEEKVGKNDGTLQGKRYFTCPPGHGGFLRASKISSLEDIASKTAARQALAAEEAFRNRKGRFPRKASAKGDVDGLKGASADSDADDSPPKTETCLLYTSPSPRDS